MSSQKSSIYQKTKIPQAENRKSKGQLKTMQNSRPPLLEAGGIFN